MLKKIKAWRAERSKKRQMKRVRNHYFRKTGVSLDKYSDAELERFKQIGEWLKENELSPEDAIKYLTTIVAMDKERGKR